MNNMTDKIRPAHYDGDACMRCIEDATLGLVGHEAFCIGQVIKYLWRAGSKPGEAFGVDRDKANWYYERLIQQGPVHLWPDDLYALLLGAINKLFDETDPQQIRQRLLALPQALRPCVENLPTRTRA